MKYKQLILIDPEKNNNRVFTMVEKGNGVFETSVERVDGSLKFDSSKPRITRPYPMALWDKVLSGKLKEGYIDRTVFGAMSATTSKEKKFQEIEDARIAAFWQKIMDAARKAIRNNYSVSLSTITPEMVERAQGILDTVATEADIAVCNKLLVELFAVIMRKMANVSDYLMTETNRQEVLCREQELLDIVKSQINMRVKTKDAEPDRTILDALGVTIRRCNGREKNMLKEMMGDESKYFRHAFRCKNLRTHARQDEYVNRRKLKKEDVHLLFHGTRTENLYSLITEGFSLNPNAVRTGSLFGNAGYFAIKKQAHKSLRYTDLRVHGVSYANGSSKTAYLLVYDVAYNNPMHLTAKTGRGMRNFTKASIAPYDAVHAHTGYDMGGRRLVNDEVMAYDPENGQVDIHYIIEVGI